MAKVTHLSVHKNTRAQRRRAELRDEMRRMVSSHARRQDISGYILVSWGADERSITASRTDWAHDGHFTPSQLGTFVRDAILRKTTSLDACDIFNHHGREPEDDGA